LIYFGRGHAEQVAPPASGEEQAIAMTARAKKAKTTDLLGMKGPTYTRRYPRFGIDLRMQVKMFQAGEFRSCWGRSTELGQDGIGATLTGSLESGEIVTLEIPLPLSAYPLKVRAIVRYSQGLHYGFEFLTLNDMQRDTIRRVCQMLATKA
jgi:hypothetical protein